MSTAVAFHTQLASIMEVLANAAVAEICELVDNGYAMLQLEISRSQKENEALRRKLRLMELKVARASALRAAGVGSPFFVGGRARLQSSHQGSDLKRTSGGESLLPRVTQAPASCGNNEPNRDTGQDTAKRKLAAVKPSNLTTPVIKVEDDEAWDNSEPDKGVQQVPGERILSPTETEAPPPVAKQEVAAQGSGSNSCSWARGEVNTSPTSNPKQLSTSKRSEPTAVGPEPAGYDCIMYDPQLQRGPCNSQHPPTDDPGCSYSGNTSVSIPVPPDSENGFSFPLSDVTHGGAEHQQPAVFPDSRQRVPLATGEPQPHVREEMQAGTNSYVVREDWATQDDFGNAANYSREDPAAKLFSCSFCGKTLACLKNLKTHIRVHTGEKPFGCGLCGKRFSDSSNLKRHQSVHTGEKRYGCVHCGKRFAQSGSLKVHMSVHTGYKQFRCSHCGKTFISAGHLRRHINAHEGDKHLPITFQ